MTKAQKYLEALKIGLYETIMLLFFKTSKRGALYIQESSKPIYGRYGVLWITGKRSKNGRI